MVSTVYMPYFVLYSNVCTAGLIYSDIVLRLCTVDKVHFLVTFTSSGRSLACKHHYSSGVSSCKNMQKYVSQGQHTKGSLITVKEKNVFSICTRAIVITKQAQNLGRRRVGNCSLVIKAIER